MSCTCRTLNNAFLARLYSHVVIKVPIRWSRLTSLEDLISSAGSGFNFVTSICVTVQQQPSIDDAQESEDGRTAQEIAEERDLGFCLPHVAASKALNALIRLLLMRIPDNHLKHFECVYDSVDLLRQSLTIPDSWRHSCALETSTLALLSEHQGATLRGFSVTRYSEPQKVSGLLMGGLEGLVITDLNIEQECEWPSTLIAQNRSTLRNLQLGVLSKMARDYAISPRASQHGLPTSFSEWAKEALPTSEGERLPTLPLETLGLYGLNLEFVIGGALGLEIDFNGMTALRLESCSGLEQAFALLRGGGGAYKPKLGSLKPFFLRHEDGSQAFAQHLIIFLTSFAGLIHLSILLDKRSKAVNDESVLNVHGKTLQTLIWDERTGPRTDTKTDTALSRKGRLKRVSMKCPNLTSLGLSLDWSRVTEPCDGTYLAVCRIH